MADRAGADHESGDLYLSPKAAAEHLGIAGSSLRRLAPIYEAVYGPLPKQPSEHGDGTRLWPAQAVERLEAGRALVAEGRAKSLEQALYALHDGSTAPPEIKERRDSAEALLAAVERLQERLDEIPALRQEVAQLREELHEPRALPPTSPSPWERPVAFGVGDAPESDREPPSEARAGSGDASGGVLVRLARRLERILGRRG
jgi:hypothetical protein